MQNFESLRHQRIYSCWTLSPVVQQRKSYLTFICRYVWMYLRQTACNTILHHSTEKNLLKVLRRSNTAPLRSLIQWSLARYSSPLKNCHSFIRYFVLRALAVDFRLMHQSIPAVPMPPRANPRALAFFFLKMGKFLGVGTHKLSKCPGVETKKEGKCLAPGIVAFQHFCRFLLLSQ